MRIMHFVTGGFSGATKVAIELIDAHNSMTSTSNILVLRRKKTTDTNKLKELEDKNINYYVVTGRSHLATINELKSLCEKLKPDLLVAHGFPEHILGRRAGMLAGIPILVQVEHNSKERYTPWKLYQSRKLSAHTACIIGVSEGVAEVLSKQNLKSPIIAIPNGIDTNKFGAINHPAVNQRSNDIIMVGRYAKSKDHVTLINSLSKLKNKGIKPNLTLVGSGRKRYKKEVLNLVNKYGLENQVTFIEYTNEVDKLLLQHKIFVMSSRFEGLNLAVLEAMASGCIVIGSRAVGVEELINDTEDGFLFDVGDDSKLASIIENVLIDLEGFQYLTVAARKKVLEFYDKKRVAKDYYRVFQELTSRETEQK